ncbi:hypothetical protein EHS25_008267 [Saitozyma podzolica]|uniref:Major facilitator superfamily (MFS) profile domain-containing protein n=1 Tax=Saitozyma podzolica TaxID=1890683 RepID=A0A427YP11_9TREE|nr:hypothetical protein EHS25_008267 [Saitozyma podzolica]
MTAHEVGTSSLDSPPMPSDSSSSSMTLLSPSSSAPPEEQPPLVPPPRATNPMPPPASGIPSGRSQSSRTARPAYTRKTSNPPNAPPTEGEPLQRTSSKNSIHAQNALRRMATHETGEGVEHEHDGPDRLDTHDEHEHEHEHEHDHDHDHSDHGHSHGPEDHAARDEEEAVGMGEGSKVKKEKKEVVLQDQTNLLPTRQVIMVFVGLTAALFCSLLDQTIVTTALPTLGRVFNRADIASWVGTAYLLTSTSMQPIYGRLSDIFGRKFVLLGSLTIFLIGSLACALAQSMIQLIIFRAIQGIGGGGILTLSMIIISDVVSLKERGKYQGITGCVIALSNSIGPILGGVFTEKVSWRWCFYINLPLTCASIVVIIFLLPLRRVRGGMVEKLKKLDWYGGVLTIAWAVLILLAFSWAGTQYSWGSAGVLAPLLIGLALLGVWLFVEAKLMPLPLVPLYVFKDGTVAAAMVTTWFSGAAFYATLYYLPTYFQIVKGASAIHSGVLILPLVLVQTTCAFTSGWLVSKTGDYWWNLVIGFAFWTIGLGLMGSTNENSSDGVLAGFQVIIGVGAGQTFQTSLMAIQAAVSRKDMATVTGMRNFMRMLGGTVALAVCSAIINNIVRAKLGVDGIASSVIDQVLSDPTTVSALGLSSAQQSAVIAAYAKGISACFYFMCPCAGISLFLTVFFIKKISLKRDDDAVKKAEAKAWVESKKAKRRRNRNGGDAPDGASEKVAEEGRSRQTSVGSSHAEAYLGLETRCSAEQSTEEKTGFRRLEKEVEEAGRGMEEAAGVQPSAREV